MDLSQCVQSGCLAGYFLFPSNKCYNPCPNGTFAKTNGNPPNTCSTCQITCATCSGGLATNCLTCNSSYFLQGTECKTTCPSNLPWKNTLTNTCEIVCPAGPYIVAETQSCVKICSNPYIILFVDT